MNCEMARHNFECDKDAELNKQSVFMEQSEKPTRESTDNKIKQYQNKMPIVKNLVESESEELKLGAEINDFNNNMATRLQNVKLKIRQEIDSER